MNVRKYGLVFLILCQVSFGEIREIIPLEDLSNSLLQGTSGKQKVQQNKQTEKSKATTEKGDLEKPANISGKDTSSYVDISKKERKGDIFYQQGEEKPFTGVFALFMGDWIQYIETYKNGVLDGESSWYTDKGSRILYEYYQNGKLQGKQLSYYENGNPKAEIYYDKGKVTGVICFDRDGKIVHKSIFEKGTGLWKVFWENGNVLETGKYKNFKKDGVWKKYNENGSLDSTLEYNKGRLLKEIRG